MSDKEIMKALECCNDEYNVCEECPYRDTGYCERHIIEASYGLIKRQQAEIEKARAEAIKDFADRFDDVLAGLRDEYAHLGRPEYGLVCEVVHHKLLKTVNEMVGKENET